MLLLVFASDSELEEDTVAVRVLMADKHTTAANYNVKNMEQNPICIKHETFHTTHAPASETANEKCNYGMQKMV